MNIIYQLLDPGFVKELFRQEVLPVCPEFRSVDQIEIVPIKKHIWHTTYHVVFCFNTTFTTIGDKKITWQIYCTAHSSEPRQNVHEVLKFLWKSDFSQDRLTVPQPLFYSEHFRAAFYRGVEGESLYKALKDQDLAKIEAGLKLCAAWFAKLHRLPTDGVPNFNEENSRLATAFPGVKHIYAELEKTYPQHLKNYKLIYDYLIAAEEDFLNSTKKRWLVHGDAHPENIILIDDQKIAIVDFADFGLTDFARDLGSFLQQLEYMSARKLDDRNYAQKLKNIFLDSYLELTGITIDESLNNRINVYFNWTALRTASYFLFKHNPQPDRAGPLLEGILKNLNISF